MPLVTNPGFDRATAHVLLHNAKAQERAAKSLAQLAERDQYVGWQLDFEGIDPADKLAYTRFVARVAARLHHDHRLLSVAVVPRFSDTFPDTLRSRVPHRRVGRGVRFPRTRARCRFPGAHGL